MPGWFLAQFVICFLFQVTTMLQKIASKRTTTRTYSLGLSMFMLLHPSSFSYRYYYGAGVNALRLGYPERSQHRTTAVSTKRQYRRLEDHEIPPKSENSKDGDDVNDDGFVSFVRRSMHRRGFPLSTMSSIPFGLPSEEKTSSSSSNRNIEEQSNHVESQDSKVSPPLPFTIAKTAENTKNKNLVVDVNDLRRIVLDEEKELRQVRFGNTRNDPLFADIAAKELLNHQVIQLVAERFHSKSLPGHRLDNSTLALAMEGGGMRGCVSAGMASAIASLGCWDAFDVVYGSSAGSVIGAYMVSRQVCMDVYVDILPAAKQKFVCKKRMVNSLASRFIDWILSAAMKDSQSTTASSSGESLYLNRKQPLPGMNISFVLDGIMGSDHGIRPLDFDLFEQNGKTQPLRVAASCFDEATGEMYSRCFGAEDFKKAVSTTVDGTRYGLFACLEASMTVPGATGPPVRIVEKDETNNSDEAKSTSKSFFDAFCFEPLPYRSAVAEGATHVLVLCSRPEGFEPKTTPGVYEQGVAPIYFRSHGHPEVSKFFEKGGQQYIYAEDLLTLEQGKRAARKKAGKPGRDGEENDDKRVLVPPPVVLYGQTQQTKVGQNREQEWKRSHLLPLKVPKGTPELPALEQDKAAVLAAVRAGYSAAYDLLVPALGLDHEDKLGDLTGEQAAKLMFPDFSESQQVDAYHGSSPSQSYRNDSKQHKIHSNLDLEDDRIGMATGELLQEKIFVAGDPVPSIKSINTNETLAMDENLFVEGMSTNDHRSQALRDPFAVAPPRNEKVSALAAGHISASELHVHAETLLSCLPGFQDGRLQHLAKGLRYSYGRPTTSSIATRNDSPK